MRLWIALLGIGLVAATPALADNAKSPAGAPCLKDNGNPCNGNNGNLGLQGNAGHERVKIDKTPPPIDLPMPAVSGRGAYIDQIGDTNVASIDQTAPNAYAHVTQSGGANEADLSQRGTGTAYATAAQSGTGNFARIEQQGIGQNLVRLAQTGNGNWAWTDQNAVGAVHNAAQVAQNGNNNDLALFQDGSDNRAALTQTGNDNGMTVSQSGVGNRLAWTQTGNGLSDLNIVQTGGSAKGGQLQITQTRP